jgi:ethanolamine utilization protein EutA (predicted chaperonin)
MRVKEVHDFFHTVIGSLMDETIGDIQRRVDGSQAFLAAGVAATVVGAGFSLASWLQPRAH